MLFSQQVADAVTALTLAALPCPCGRRRQRTGGLHARLPQRAASAAVCFFRPTLSLQGGAMEQLTLKVKDGRVALPLCLPPQTSSWPSTANCVRAHLGSSSGKLFSYLKAPCFNT